VCARARASALPLEPGCRPDIRGAPPKSLCSFTSAPLRSL
jgi:hypothetical protein